MTEFTPVTAALGGALIGLSATLLMRSHGRVAGISGILDGLLAPAPGDTSWRAGFVGGLLVVGALLVQLVPSWFASTHAPNPAVLVLAGLLVGFGTRMGNGCTSGHGVCGLTRRSPRSLVSVVTFIGSGALAVAAARFLGGAA